MKQLPITEGTKLRIKTNESIGICTVIKIGYLADEFGDKTTVKAAKYVNEHGVPVGCTRLDQLTDVHFEIVS